MIRIPAAAWLLLSVTAVAANAHAAPATSADAAVATPGAASSPTPRPAEISEGIPDETGKRIASVTIIGPKGETDEFTRFLEIRPGDAWSARSVRRTIEVLSKLGDFSSIRAEATPRGADSIALAFHLDPVPRIRRIYVNGVKGSTAKVRASLGVSPGDPYPGDEDLRRMAEDAQATLIHDGWSRARVEVKSTTRENREVILEVNVDQGPRLQIRDIEFKGDFQGAVEESELLQASKLEIGDPMRQADVLEARRRILALHRKLGFYEARVQDPLVTADVDRPGWGKVAFLVSSGEQILVEFHGKKLAWADRKREPLYWWHFRDDKLLSLLDLENESGFTQGFADEASERIVDYYRRAGYYDCKVGSEIEDDHAKRRKLFRFEITPGRRFRFLGPVFKGTDEKIAVLSTKTLKEEFLSQSESMRDGYFVADDSDAATSHVENFLRSEGYAEARVEARDPDVDRVHHTVRVQLVVDAGDRIRVGDVIFEGNEQAPSQKLATVVAVDPIRIHPGEPLNLVYLDRAQQALESYYASIGFPYAHITYDAKPSPSKKGNVDVHFHVDESLQAFVGRVIIKGNRYTRRKVIERALSFHTGETLTPQSLQAAQDSLQQLGVFNQVNVVPWPEEEPERVRDILVGVSEANRMLLEPSIGASTEQGPRIGLRAQHRNLFGSAKSVTLRMQANWLWGGLPQKPEDLSTPQAGFDPSQIEGRVLLTYAQPSTFGQPVTSSVTGSLFEKVQTRTYGYTGNRVIASADHTTRLDVPGFPSLRDASLALSARYQVFLRDVQYLGPLGVRAEDVALEKQDLSFPSQQMYYWPLKWKIASGSVVANLDRRDDKFNPRDGYSATLAAELATTALGSDVSFLKTTASATLFKPIPWNFEVVLAARAGWAAPFDQTAGLPIDQRFHLGGTGSVRGFREDSIGPRFQFAHSVSTGGDVMALWNAELRHPLFSGIDWVLFDDAGWTDVMHYSDPNRLLREEPNPTNPGLVLRGPLVHPMGIANGAGAGLRFHTPVGPVKFDLGIDTKNLDHLRNITGWQEDVIIHFTIGDF